MNTTPAKSTSTKPTWKMSAPELARVVAENRGWTLCGPWVRDEQGRNVGIGWEMVSGEMVRLGWIVEGVGVDWRKMGTNRLRRVERTEFGHWRYES